MSAFGRTSSFSSPAGRRSFEALSGLLGLIVPKRCTWRRPELTSTDLSLPQDAFLGVIHSRVCGNMPGDADVSAALGVPRGTFSVWKNDHNHPVGRRYNDILSAIARAHPIEPASHARSKWIEGMRIAQESDDYDD